MSPRMPATPHGRMRRTVFRIAIVTALTLALALVGWGSYVSILTASNASACEVSVSDQTDETDQQLDRVLADYSRDNDGVGLQASVVLPDGTQRTAVAGYADHSKRCPLTTRHHLYVGSITKLYTAVLTMRQVDAGRLELDDPAGQWTDLELPASITIRTLLNHTSGLVSYTEDPWFLARFFGLPDKRWEPAELLAAIDLDSARFAPGSRHEYSNSNYAVLGVVLETVTERSYGSALQDLLAEETEMPRHTFYRDRPSSTPIANGYDVSVLNLGRRNLTGFRTSFETGGYAAGGVLSTASDVAYFLDTLMTGELLGAESLEEMHDFVEAPDEDVPTQTGYGLGLRRLRIGEQVLVGHTGTIPGYSGIALHNPRHGVTIAVLSNQSTIDQAALFADVQSAVLDGGLDVTRRPSP